ncbi:MAG: hypothetical protein IBX55_00200 [Methyloprofundus sp.]|nr:hypothetical protein [Methyloprofundus sp.]
MQQSLTGIIVDSHEFIPSVNMYELLEFKLDLTDLERNFVIAYEEGVAKGIGEIIEGSVTLNFIDSSSVSIDGRDFSDIFDDLNTININGQAFRSNYQYCFSDNDWTPRVDREACNKKFDELLIGQDPVFLENEDQKSFNLIKEHISSSLDDYKIDWLEPVKQAIQEASPFYNEYAFFEMKSLSYTDLINQIILSLKYRDAGFNFEDAIGEKEFKYSPSEIIKKGMSGFIHDVYLIREGEYLGDYCDEGILNNARSQVFEVFKSQSLSFASGVLDEIDFSYYCPGSAAAEIIEKLRFGLTFSLIESDDGHFFSFDREHSFLSEKKMFAIIELMRDGVTEKLSSFVKTGSFSDIEELMNDLYLLDSHEVRGLLINDLIERNKDSLELLKIAEEYIHLLNSNNKELIEVSKYKSDIGLELSHSVNRLS